MFSSATASLQAAAQPTEEDSQELQLLKNNSNRLITATSFDTSWLAGEMNRTGLLSDNDHQDITKAKTLLNDTEKAEIMLTSLKKKVALNSKHLSTFLDILILKPMLYSDTIDILKGKALINKSSCCIVINVTNITEIPGYLNRMTYTIIDVYLNINKDI